MLRGDRKNFDPQQAQLDNANKAKSACIEGRGYTVK